MNFMMIAFRFVWGDPSDFRFAAEVRGCSGCATTTMSPKRRAQNDVVRSSAGIAAGGLVVRPPAAGQLVTGGCPFARRAGFGIVCQAHF
jgi:hypothetical protein